LRVASDRAEIDLDGRDHPGAVPAPRSMRETISATGIP
jgi:hypothetical protein